VTPVDVRCQAAGDGWRCAVTTGSGTAGTRHDVTVAGDDAVRLAAARGAADVERLLVETFDFLLEREPASAILRTFDLSVVASYFPEFEAEMTQRLAP
jgi:hypothetical protein